MARYLIREELAGVELPFDAMGETTEVSGAFTFSAGRGDCAGEFPHRAERGETAQRRGESRPVH